MKNFKLLGVGMDVIDIMKRLHDEVRESAELLISTNPWGLEFRIRVYIDDEVHCRSFMVSYQAIESANFDIIGLEMDEAIQAIKHNKRIMAQR